MDEIEEKWSDAMYNILAESSTHGAHKSGTAKLAATRGGAGRCLLLDFMRALFQKFLGIMAIHRRALDSHQRISTSSGKRPLALC